MEYTVKPICLGYSEADQSGFTYMCFPGEKLALDLAYFIIKDAPKNILVDTGTWSDLMVKYWPGKTTDLQTFEESLEKEGLKPEDIDIIILTHLHHDHIGNAYKCKNAEVYVQEDEWAFACAPHPLQAQYYPTPGHTPGTQSVCVDTKEGKTVIAGMCSLYQTFEEPKRVLPEGHPFSQWEVFTQSIATDMNQAYYSCLRLKRLADVMLPCHGPGFDVRTKKYLPSS